MLIKEKADRMHQNGAQQAVTQMPQITRPDALHLAAIGQLTKDGVDEVAHAPQNRTLVRCGFGRMGFAKRGLQHNAFRAQESLQIRKPIVAIPQDHPRWYCQLNAMMSLFFSESGEEMLFFHVLSSHPLRKLPKKGRLW